MVSFVAFLVVARLFAFENLPALRPRMTQIVKRKRRNKQPGTSDQTVEMQGVDSWTPRSGADWSPRPEVGGSKTKRNNIGLVAISIQCMYSVCCTTAQLHRTTDCPHRRRQQYISL